MGLQIQQKNSANGGKRTMKTSKQIQADVQDQGTVSGQ